jgi:hypothetical protein
MAEEHDAKVSQHYRGLQGLEPPPELDRTIVAASRGAVAPPARRRWYYSLAAAAVLVFAVALTLHIERQHPDAEGLPQAAAPQLRLERELRGVIKQPAEKPDEVKPRIARDAEPPSSFALDPRASAADTLAAAAAPPPQEPAAAAPQALAKPAPAARRIDETRRRAANVQTAPAKTEAQPEVQLRREEALAQQYAAAPAAAPMLAPAAPERPERWLERIAELRSRGKHAEADQELVQFRRVYPSYPLSEVMRERVEGR